MKRVVAWTAVLLFLLSSCGGAESDGGAGAPTSDATTAGSGGSASGGGDVVDEQPPGRAFASVDGVEYTFDLPGGVACGVSDDEFAFSFRIGDNEVVLGGGASISGGQWFGSLTLQIFGDDGVTEYSAKLIDNPSAVAVAGESVSYSGPMEKFPPSTGGSIPEPEDVGNGTFSATCG